MSKIESKLKNYLGENQERVDEKDEDVDWRRIEKVLGGIQSEIEKAKKMVKNKDKNGIENQLQRIEKQMNKFPEELEGVFKD